MRQKLVILCLPLSGLGHINPCLGLCEALRRRGHRIVFAMERSWKGMLEKEGFEEEVYDERQAQGDEESGKFWSGFFERVCHYFRGDNEQQMHVLRESMIVFYEAVKFSNKRIGEIITTIKPDIIIHDRYLAYPSVVKSGVPFVCFFPMNPLMGIRSSKLPPFGTDEPLNDSRNWKKVIQIRHNIMSEDWETVNKMMVENGLPPLEPGAFHYESEHLNILMYPRALFNDYESREPLKKNWVLLEHAIRATNNQFKLPRQLEEKPGKIIYLSMGSIASSDSDLMERLVSMLRKTQHKVIVSMGANHDKFELAENMWGMARVPQLEVLKISDLFITHGGNNSFIEGLYFGVPMIVMPLFDDQYANAQRIVESNLGIKMNPFRVDENELFNTIETLLNDTDLHKRLSVVSKQLQESTSLNDVVERIESIVGQ